jgi:hypothetical protein
VHIFGFKVFDYLDEKVLGEEADESQNSAWQ